MRSRVRGHPVIEDRETRQAGELQPLLRRLLELVAERLDLGAGHTKLLLEYQDGNLLNCSLTRVRVPASKLPE